MTEADPPLPTHEVFFFNAVQEVGPVQVFVFEDDEDTDEEDKRDDMLEAAAVAQNSVHQWDIKVRRLIDNHEETIDPGDAKDWWA